MMNNVVVNKTTCPLCGVESHGDPVPPHKALNKRTGREIDCLGGGKARGWGNMRASRYNDTVTQYSVYDVLDMLTDASDMMSSVNKSDITRAQWELERAISALTRLNLQRG